MNKSQRDALTKALSGHVGAIAADLRAQMLAGGVVRNRAKQLHVDEQVGEDFEVWTDLLSRRAAVLWVLKTVYVRVLEDRGLLRPGRLLDPEAQQLFEKLAPNLGETAFLSWVFRDLASPRGGLPELFAPQPAEVAVPAHTLSRSLIAFWRAKDADTSFQWSFAGEAFAGELMGDLYQELDPVVKERYALCQTPDFVRDFMLGQTLTPAIEELGADQIRLLDPACGSGHFLLDALRRLVDATAAQHKDWPRRKVVEHALDRVVGIDLNDYACALARTRMVMTAAELAGISNLSEASDFHPHVYWADGLEQVERDDDRQHIQLDLMSAEKVLPPRAMLTRPHVRAVLRPILKRKFQVVVGNPPYITERDPARKEYHREGVKKKRRYVSAYREYSLAAPFTERALQLAAASGWVGLIIANSFMRREFGKPLIEEVFASTDMHLLIDSSQAFLPNHGTQTVIVFARNRPPMRESVRTVMSKRGEHGTPADPAQGQVWKSIIDGFAVLGFDNEFVSVADLPRTGLNSHPWSLGGGGISQLRALLEARASERLDQHVAEIGVVCVLREDDLFIIESAAERQGLKDFSRPCLEGWNVRDWGFSECRTAVWPYDSVTNKIPEGEHRRKLERYFWRWRSILEKRTAFGKSQIERGLAWFEYSMLFHERANARHLVVFPKVATHNHFALYNGGMAPIASTHIVLLKPGASVEDHMLLVALLNSSTACFWMKQIFQPKSNSSQRHHPDPERKAYEFSATGLGGFPVPAVGGHRKRLVELAQVADESMRARARAISRDAWIGSLASAETLRAALAERWREADRQRQRALFAQEEIDWIVYFLYGLCSELLVAPEGPQRLNRGQRAFERYKGRRSFVRESGQLVPVEQAEVETSKECLPTEYSGITAAREQLIAADEAISTIEGYMFKRHWRDTDENQRESVFRERWDLGQLREWLCVRLEDGLRRTARPSSIPKLVVEVQDDNDFLTVVEVYARSRAFDLTRVIEELVLDESVANHPFHIYSPGGLSKHDVWEGTWTRQRQLDAEGRVEEILSPPTYSQGSRGKSKDFARDEYWRLRGALDVPKERFIAFTEVPGRASGEMIYGWAGWTPAERVKSLLALDEDCENQGFSLADRIALLDSAWRLIPEVAHDDAATGARLKAELQALVGTDGPSKVLLDDWKKRFPPPGKARGRSNKKAKAVERAEGDDEDDE